MKKATRNRLIVAASEQNAELFYVTGFSAPDTFAFAEVGGRKHLLLSNLEVDRGRKEAQVDEVHALSDFEQPGKKATYADALIRWLRFLKVRSAQVPHDFPLGLGRFLEKQGVKLQPISGFLYPEREFKTDQDLRGIRAGIRVAEVGMERGIEILRASKIGKKGVLQWGGMVLTSERLRAEIEVAILYQGGKANGTIVAGGEAACDPHERGHGPLRAGELIILDIFPRDTLTGYYGDITRTVVKGRATERQRHLWQTCLDGQRSAIRAIKPGVDGGKIHQQLVQQFADAGYPTKICEGRWQGFFHGTGHGLGLDVHEPPRFSVARFAPRQVVTVEPGIYMPGLGGVRHEDDVVVTETGCRVLSKFPKELEID